MEASGSGARPGPDPFLWAEIVHSSERTRITRLFLPGRTVIRKEPLGPDGERRVRHEVALLERPENPWSIIPRRDTARGSGHQDGAHARDLGRGPRGLDVGEGRRAGGDRDAAVVDLVDE